MIGSNREQARSHGGVAGKRGLLHLVVPVRTKKRRTFKPGAQTNDSAVPHYFASNHTPNEPW